MKSVLEEAIEIQQNISYVNEVRISWKSTPYQNLVVDCVMEIYRKQDNQQITFKHTKGDIVSRWEYECNEKLPYKLECKIDSIIDEFDLGRRLI